jgi:hypothetical protein
MKKMERKNFLKSLTAASAAGFLLQNQLIAQAPSQDPAPFSIDMVKDFVIAGHGNFSKVQDMLKEHPNLLYCKYDWGNGDFEAAIEGAGHVGNKEIANFLIDQGSRVTIYVLTMLGRGDLVKPILEAYPTMLNAKGPHGFTLLHHAKVGGAEAEELYAWLDQKGLKEDRVKLR